MFYRRFFYPLTDLCTAIVVLLCVFESVYMVFCDPPMAMSVQLPTMSLFALIQLWWRRSGLGCDFCCCSCWSHWNRLQIVDVFLHSRACDGLCSALDYCVQCVYSEATFVLNLPLWARHTVHAVDMQCNWYIWAAVVGAMLVPSFAFLAVIEWLTGTVWLNVNETYIRL